MDTNSNITLDRRAFVLGSLGVIGFGVLTTRLYYLQVVKAEDYKSLSENNRFNFDLIVPSRGRIVDRNGVELAVNKQEYRVVLVPEQVIDLEDTLDRISNVVTLGDGAKKRIRKDVKDNPKFVPILIKDHLDWEGFTALNMKTPELSGVFPQVGEGRSYPFEGIFSHVLGYVGRAGPKEVQENSDPLLRHPTFRIGKTGVEQSADNVLRGKSGRLKVEVNAVGRVVREWPDPSQQATSGKDVWLTLDANLQSHAAELFEEDSGGAAVIDVMTGELRTLISMPTFDGNLFVSGLTQSDMTRLNSDEKRPQFNKVISGGYPPASTFKMNVMLAGLKHQHIKRSEKIICTGKVRVGNRQFHCWKRRGHGPVNLHEALKYSCDVYFYEIAQRIQMEQVREIAEQFGFGQTYDLGISGQASGIVPDASWKRAKLGQGWRMGDSLNAVIGQGFVLATPLQLAVMSARIANGRKAITPHLIISEDVPAFKNLEVDQLDLDTIRWAMRSVCQEPGGTAYAPGALGSPSIEMAGKTGTGQVRGISASERASGVLKNRQLPWKFRDHSIYVGYAPFDKPRFAVGVVVEHGGSGSGRAAQISRGLLKRALELDGYMQETRLNRQSLPL